MANAVSGRSPEHNNQWRSRLKRPARNSNLPDPRGPRAWTRSGVIPPEHSVTPSIAPIDEAFKDTRMIDTRTVKKEMLKGLVEVKIADDALGFRDARRVADGRASEALVGPILLAWFDRKQWRHSPAIC